MNRSEFAAAHDSYIAGCADRLGRTLLGHDEPMEEREVEEEYPDDDCNETEQPC